MHTVTSHLTLDVARSLSTPVGRAVTKPAGSVLYTPYTTHPNLDSDYYGIEFKVTSYHVLCCGVRRAARAMTGAPSDTGQYGTSSQWWL